MVEKRLLSRFKDRNPAPLDNLDVVSEETYQRLVELCEGVERAQGRLAVSAASLRCAARLVALLAQHRFQLPCKDHALLLAHLFPDVTDTDDQVKEEHWRAFWCPVLSCWTALSSGVRPCRVSAVQGDSKNAARSCCRCRCRRALSQRGSLNVNPFLRS